MLKNKLLCILAPLCCIAFTGCAVMTTPEAPAATTPVAQASPSPTIQIAPAPPAPVSTHPMVAQAKAPVLATPPVGNLEPVQVPGALSNGQFISLWDAMRMGFTMNHYYNNPRVQYFVQSYSRDPSFIANITTQATPYLYPIMTMIEARNMPTELALLPIVESGFKPTARSYCGAVGLWQLMPETARENAANESYWFNGREGVQESTGAALNYLKYLYNYFNGDWLLALAAYNSGPGTVQNAISANAARGLSTDFWSLNLPQATENYVPQLLALAIIVNDPSNYGIALPAVPNKPLLGSAVIPQQMSLSQVAKFAGINENELKALNPGFKRNITPPPSSGINLNLPLSKVMTFEENCAANPGVTGLERYTVATIHAKPYGVYKVRRGDTLSTVSRFTGVPIASLKQYNHLKSNVLRPGQVLKYPVDHTAAFGYVTYIVKPGDNLYTIAKKYHVNAFDLAQWNSLSDHATLHVGQRLVIRRKINY